MGQPKLSPDVVNLSVTYPAGVLGNPTPIAQRFAHTGDLRQSALHPAEPPSAAQSKEPPAVAREATASSGGRLPVRTRWLISALTLAALLPSLILGALWLGLIGMTQSPPAVPPPEPRTVAASAVLTVSDRIKVVAGEAVSFPIALDGTDGVPSRSVIVVKGLPQGGNFSEGRPYGDSEWTLKPDQIGDLNLVLPAAANGEFKLGIALIAPDDRVVAEAQTLLEVSPAPAEPAAVVEAAASSPDGSEATPTGGPEAVAALPPAPGTDAGAVAEAVEQPVAAEAPAAETAAAAPTRSADQATGGESTKETVEPSVYVNMREGPSSSAPVIGVIAKGTKLAVLDRKRGWLNVTDPESGKAGWIYRGLIAGEESANARVRRVAPPEAEQKSESFWGRVGRWLTPG